MCIEDECISILCRLLPRAVACCSSGYISWDCGRRRPRKSTRLAEPRFGTIPILVVLGTWGLGLGCINASGACASSSRFHEARGDFITSLLITERLRGQKVRRLGRVPTLATSRTSTLAPPAAHEHTGTSRGTKSAVRLDGHEELAV